MGNRASDLVILNGQPVKAGDYRPAKSTVLIYEVIRLMDGRFLFLDDHLKRLRNSCTSSGIEFPDYQTLVDHLNMLVSQTSAGYGNIRLVVSEVDGNTDVAAFFVPHFYPSENDYIQGVITKTYTFERPDPTIKKWNEKFRKDVGAFIQKEKIYEAILVNDKGELTEGSRSNLFFINHQSAIVTAPEYMILAGITRKYILDICKKHNYRVMENAISKVEAANMKSCFLSGTSPKVLPVRQLDSLTYDAGHPLLKTIMKEFNQLIHTPDSL
jgi:branched-chain amino acid aminotransferase